MTVREFFEKEFRSSPKATRKILDSATVGRTFYAALEYVEGGKREVVALVCPINYTRERLNFGYKDMTEDMGPCEAECPTRILDLLSETTVEYALNWRKRCREFARKKANAPKVGEYIRLAEPIKFTDGSRGQVFQFLGRTTFRCVDGGMFRCRITRWQSRNYEKLASPTPAMVAA